MADGIAAAALETEQERKRRLREEAVAAARAVPGILEENVANLEQAGEAGRAGIRAQAATALAAGLSSGQAGGGGSLAAARQAARTEGLTGAEFEAGLSTQVGGLRQQAAQAQLEAITFEREAGSQAAEAQERITQLRSSVNSIVEKHKGFFNDDEDAMSSEIRSLAEQEDNDEVADFLLRESVNVLDKADAKVTLRDGTTYTAGTNARDV